RRRPGGMWGHLSDEEFGTRYDPPSIRWLAAMADGNGVVWGKAVALNEQTRDYYRYAKAAKALVGTSLFAMGEADGDSIIHMNLITLDIADPARVGVPMTA